MVVVTARIELRVRTHSSCSDRSLLARRFLLERGLPSQYLLPLRYREYLLMEGLAFVGSGSLMLHDDFVAELEAARACDT